MGTRSKDGPAPVPGNESQWTCNECLHLQTCEAEGQRRTFACGHGNAPTYPEGANAIIVDLGVALTPTWCPVLVQTSPA
jgi:hypothetical protein